MDSGTKEYTFFWSIENYSYCWQKNGEYLISPPFTTNGLEGKIWLLYICPRGDVDDRKGHTSLYLCRGASDDGPESISIKFELSVLASDGSFFSNKANESPSFTKGKGNGWGRFLTTDEILSRKKTDYLPQDILTVRCKIWKGEGNVRNIGQSSARTRIRVDKISFLHEVERFSTLQPNVMQTIRIPSHSSEKSFITSSLHFTDCSGCEEKLIVEIVPSDAAQLLRKCELYLLDESEGEIECGKADSRDDADGKSICALPLSFKRKEVLNRKSELLPNDKLTLLCKCTFSAGIEFQRMEETVYKTPLRVVKLESDPTLRKNPYKAEEKLSSYPSALEDMKAFYINKSPTDVQLEAKTKSFPAHKVVLCARSPVFERMLTTDMKEKQNSCIQVNDLGDDVMQQLLLFLYSDTVEHLDWEMATQLYYAADKYEIGKLKVVCASFLVENLTPTRAGDLLLLADTHSDSDLKQVVENFILEHEREVFVSKEWEMLMEKNPLLVMKAMFLRYTKNKF